MMWVTRFKNHNNGCDGVLLGRIMSTEEGVKRGVVFLNEKYPGVEHWPVPLSDLTEDELRDYAASIGWTVGGVRACMKP